jgi:hypothetical protein
MLILFAMVTPQVTTAPADSWNIPVAQRVEWINARLRAQLVNESSNAAEELERALAVYRSPADIAIVEKSPEVRTALDIVDANWHALMTHAQWPAAATAGVKLWVDSNQDALSILATACQKDRCITQFHPADGRLASTFDVPRLSKLRQLSSFVGVHANSRALNGDWDQALAWNRRRHKLATFIREMPDTLGRRNGQAAAINAYQQLLEFMHRNQEVEFADHLKFARAESSRQCPADLVEAYETLFTIEVLENHYAWATQPAAHKTIEENINAVLTFSEEFIAEMGLDELRTKRRPRFQTTEEYRTALLSTSADAARLVLEAMDDRYGRWRASPLPIAMQEADQLEADFTQIAARHPFTSFCHFARFNRLHQYREMSAILDSYVAAADCIHAIVRYRSQHGAFPESLDALSKAGLSHPPIDPFSGQPLIYKTHRDGFTLYSVGPNGRDDGGRRSTDDQPDDEIFWPPPIPEFDEP